VHPALDAEKWRVLIKRWELIVMILEDLCLPFKAEARVNDI
jgi:hypothetical protein